MQQGASARLAVAVEALFESDGWGGPDEELLSRYPTVSGFLKMLPGVISFGATAEGAPVLAAMRALPALLELLGISYRPALADLPDQKGWRIKGDADYGP